MWLSAFLEEHCQFGHKTSLSTQRLVVSTYGAQIGEKREETKWPVVESAPNRNSCRGHPGIYCCRRPPKEHSNDFRVWLTCSCCGAYQSYDRLRHVGRHILCYACFDQVRVLTADVIHQTLSRSLLSNLLPRDVTFQIYQHLYLLMLKDV